MTRASARVLAALLFIASPVRAAADPERPKPEQAYLTAAAAMRSLGIPSSVTYHSAWTSTGAGFTIAQEGKRIVVRFGAGGAFQNNQTYDLTFSSADRTVAVTVANDHLGGTASWLLDPTWAGAYDVLRYGLRGDAPSAVAQPAPASAPPEAPASASAAAIAPSFYRVTDGGSGTCPSGEAGRVLTLSAIRDPQAHPLTEVTIDVTNDRFCSMRFKLTEPGAGGMNGDYELHFTQVAAYWLVSGGFADLAVRRGGAAGKRVVLRWENSNLATPPATAPP